MRAKYEKHPSCERMNWGKIIEWKDVYKKLNNKKLESELRVNNILIANNALNLNFKINKHKNKCRLCQRGLESLEHTFLECRFSQSILNTIKFENKIRVNKETILLNTDLNLKDSFQISVYKYVVWKVRNVCLYKENVNKSAMASNLINKWLNI